MFYIKKIDDTLYERIKGKSYKDDCALPLDSLRYLHVLHKDIRGVVHEGEMICNAAIAEALIDIFRKLYGAAYPIAKIHLIDEYNADDELSMMDNNSSCFNYRLISHTNTISNHGLGLAVDINPLYNPYVKEVDGVKIIEPAASEPYLDRNKAFPYKIAHDDICCRLFKEHGFEWGGEWEDRKDYQHFAYRS